MLEKRAPLNSVDDITEKKHTWDLKSQIAQRLARLRLQARKPGAKRIEHEYHGNPDEIDHREAITVVFREKKV